MVKYWDSPDVDGDPDPAELGRVPLVDRVPIELGFVGQRVAEWASLSGSGCGLMVVVDSKKGQPLELELGTRSTVSWVVEAVMFEELRPQRVPGGIGPLAPSPSR